MQDLTPAHEPVDRKAQLQRREMLPPLFHPERKIQDKLGVERMGDATECRETRLVLSALESGYRRLGDPASSTKLGLREALPDSECKELTGDPLVGVEFLER